MPEYLPVSLPFRVADLPPRRPQRFSLAPDAAARGQLAQLLGLESLTAFTFVGEIRPEGRGDFRLEGELLATAVQACVVTLAPVVTEIRETVLRRYLSDMVALSALAASEMEIPEDDSAEPLGAEIDPGAVAAEALALALPLYPRAPGVPPAAVSVAPGGRLDAAETGNRPFAVLAQLRNQLKTDDDSGAKS